MSARSRLFEYEVQPTGFTQIEAETARGNSQGEFGKCSHPLQGRHPGVLFGTFEENPYVHRSE